MLDEVKTIGVKESELNKVILQKEDLLVVEGNGSPDQIGRVAVWNGKIDPCVHQNHLVKVRMFLPNTSQYILYWLLSPLGREIIRKVSSSTSGLYTLSLSKVKSLFSPICSLEEQYQIVQEIESRLSVCAHLEQEIEKALRQSEALRQSILKKAFEGRLVPQDPNDEPAEVLLKRIGAEKFK